MTETQKEKLESLGVDISETLERFVGNEALYFRCLSKFKDDRNYSIMKEAIAENDSQKAFDGAHALKGVSANLGLNHLYGEVKEITEIFRASSMDYDCENLLRIDDEYNRALDTISSL